MYIPPKITKLTIGEKVKRIPDYIFYQCSGLTSVTIPNSVTGIGHYAFSGCSGLTSVTIPNSVTGIGESAFSGCSGLTSVTIPNSVTTIWDYTFLYCSGLTSVTIPNSVTEIGYHAFSGCNSLKELRIPKTVHYNDDDWITYSLNSTITTATMELQPASFLKIVDEAGKEISLREAATIPGEYKYKWDGNTVKFSHLRPGQTAYFHILGISFYASSKNIDIHFSILETYADMNVAEASFDPEDFEITDYYWKLGNNDEIHQKRIDIPFGSKTPSFYIVGDDYYNCSSNINMYFPDPEFTECDAVATSLTKARLTAKCNLSTGATASIEWRRDDAPDNVKSKVENCPVVNGTLMGELRGLKDDVYYKFRPFYERDGEKFYGEWVGFYTGDANVYFEPEVGTLPAYITDNNAELEGYAFPGTDDVSESGIEYRNTGKATRAEAEWTRVAASSSTFFKVRLDNLEYNSNYEYRAFAVAGDKTYYGDTAQFSIGNDPSGIESVIPDSDSRMKVSLYRNPVVGNPKVIVNAEEENVDCYIHSITGMLMKKCTVAADGTPQEVDADLRPGMYIVTVSGKTGISSVRMIVK